MSHTVVAGVLLQLRTVGSILPREPKCILVWAISSCPYPICQAELMQTTAWKNLRKSGPKESGPKKGFELWSSLIADASSMVCLIWGQTNLVL